MVEHGRSQLQMMLLQQSGPGSLPLSNLAPEQFLDFSRKIEKLIIAERLSPLIVYWSSQSAERLLPSGQDYRDLKREAFCVSVFSQGQSEPPDEWCLLVESQGLCLIVYGQQSADPDASNQFLCAGSLDPQVVHQAFNQMLPLWQFIDLAASNRLEDARSNLGAVDTQSGLVQRCRADWPVVKLSPREGQLIQAAAVPPEIAVASNMLVAPEEVLTGHTAAPPPDNPAPGHTSEAAPRRKRSNSPEQAGRTTAALQEMVAVDASSMPLVIPEVASGFPLAAQGIVQEIVKQLRHSSDLSAILQLAIERLVEVTSAHRGLIWQVEGDQLAVTTEYSSSGHTCFVGERLGAQESTAIVLDLRSRFPDEFGSGVISVADTYQDTNLHKMSSTLASLIELGGVRARLVAQLRCRSILSGFVELQQCNQTRQWSDQDASVIQSVAEILSVVVQQSLDQSNIETDAHEMKLLNEIANLFRESRGLKSQSHDMVVRSVKLVADHMGFVQSQIYLYNPDEEKLIPHIVDGQASSMELIRKDNPFVTVYESGRAQVINAEYTRKGDPFFGHETALVVPLMAEGERLGVLGLWQRLPNRQHLNRDLALTIAGQLANIIRADQAIAQIREDQSRESLINKVSSAIRESLKEVETITETLVLCLRDYFDLEFCVVSLYDPENQSFGKTKHAQAANAVLADGFAQQLFSAVFDRLKQGQTVFLLYEELIGLLGQAALPGLSAGSATIVPLIYGGTFKSALAMISRQRNRPLPEKDMKMVADLADRVAVVVSHAELFAQVERQAITDPMTGLYNRRHFNEQLSKEIDRFQRFGRPFSYLICDLDFLKKINDGLGHQYGDAAIKHIASVLKRTVRDVDTAARYGGEEFVVLLPETDVVAARTAAERLCLAIAEQPVDGVGTVTASVGVSTFPTDADDRDKLTEMADQAMYLAKHRGRNQVCSVSADLMPSLQQRGQEALEVQQEALKNRAEEMSSIDLRLIAEHGILGIMGAVIKLIEARDSYSKDRSARAADYASRLAQALHLSKEHINIISLSAVLNNVGKIAMPESILQKPGPLTEEERKMVQQSPTIGFKILEPAKHLHRVAAVVEAYHEHWDGTGYPRGLKGDEIPLESRIIALIDAYIAMTSDRPYRKALSHQEAVKLIQSAAAKDYDPRLVKLFVGLLQKEARNK